MRPLPRADAGAPSAARLMACALLAAVACGAGAGTVLASPERALLRGDRFRLEAAAIDDSLLANAANEPASVARAHLWGGLELEALAARLRDRLALQGSLEAAVRLVLRPGEGTTPGEATLRVDSPHPTNLLSPKS